MLVQLRDFCAAAGGDQGQALVEYTLILLLVALVAVPMLTAIGVDLGNVFTTVSGAL